MKTVLLAVVGVVFFLIGAGVALMYSGVYDVSASTPHSALSNWAMRTTMESSMQRRAQDINMLELSSPTLQLAGINDFEAMCVGCHGAPGKARGPTGQGINPPAPDLKQIAQRRTPADDDGSAFGDDEEDARPRAISRLNTITVVMSIKPTTPPMT